MTGGSIGWQIGVQSTDLVLLVMNRQGVEDLLADKFTLGGNRSRSPAGPVGRSARRRRQTSGSRAQILAYSRSKGLVCRRLDRGQRAFDADGSGNRGVLRPRRSAFAASSAAPDADAEASGGRRFAGSTHAQEARRAPRVVRRSDVKDEGVNK